MLNPFYSVIFSDLFSKHLTLFVAICWLNTSFVAKKIKINKKNREKQNNNNLFTRTVVKQNKLIQIKTFYGANYSNKS